MVDGRAALAKGSVILVGDGMVYLLAIVLGFLAHGELGPGAWGRLLSTLIPFVTAWLLISPWIVGWPPPIDRSPSPLWRPDLELGPGAWGRLLSTLIPFVTAWLLISPWIVGWPPPIDRSPSRLWRPAL